jgi:hypothetical protein
VIGSCRAEILVRRRRPAMVGEEEATAMSRSRYTALAVRETPTRQLLDVIPAAAVLQMAGARTGLGWSAYPARVRLGSSSNRRPLQAFRQCEGGRGASDRPPWQSRPRALGRRPNSS